MTERTHALHGKSNPAFDVSLFIAIGGKDGA